jgi:hypothetical protein
MAQLLESKSERLTYKLYTDAAIDASTEPVMATDPAATGGQILRHVSHNLSLTRDIYRPNEKRQDLQRPMGSHGTGSVPGTINGFLSPGTHQDLFKAVLRSTWSAGASLDDTDLTSATFDSTTSKVTFGGGDPVALGMGVGKILRFTNTASNNATNFVCLSFGGTSNREVTIYPAPTTETADISFEVVVTGKDLILPATGQTSYKFAFEAYNSLADIARFYSECRMGGFDLSASVNNNVGLNFNLLGRNMSPLNAGSAPFFSGPTVETTTDIATAMEGLVRLNGTTLAVATALSLKVNLNATAAKVKNADGLAAGILLDDAMVDGDFTAFLTDASLFTLFKDKTEVELLLYYPSNGSANAPAQTFYLPRVRINSANEQEIDGAKAVQCSFEAARYVGSGAGIPGTTLQIVDTEVA